MCFGSSLEDVLDGSVTQVPCMPKNPINITRNNSISSFNLNHTNASNTPARSTSFSSLRSDSGKSFSFYPPNIASESSNPNHYVRRRNSGSVRSSLYSHPRPSCVPR